MAKLIILIFLGFAGFLLAGYIALKKRRKEHIVCPLKANCDTVIHSPYSRFFGISVEWIGVFYYAAIAGGYGVLASQPEILPHWFAYALFFLTGMAFLFSMYLTAVQIFTLKEYCTWCLFSAGICTIIFSISSSVTIPAVTPFLASQAEFIAILHVMGMAIGLGAATVSDVLFFKFLRDFRISQKEEDILETLGDIIWFALGIIVMSGVGLFLPEAERLLSSPKFIMKMFIVTAIIFNGVGLNLIIEPHLKQISFGEKHVHKSGELLRHRRLAFAFGAISFVSWYSAFLLGALRAVPLSLPFLFYGYLVLVVVGIVMSQVIERSIAKRARKMQHGHKKQKKETGIDQET